MRKKIVNIFFLLCNVIICTGQNTLSQGLQALKKWEAGQTVTIQDIEQFGIENCFLAEEIPDDIWERMQGKTYKENPHIFRQDLRHIRTLHWDYDQRIHIGEMICNKIISNDLVQIFKQLYEARYPIQRMVLPDEYDADDERQMRDNNTSCFCYRSIAKSQTLSKHALGMAVDLNTLYNPYVRRRKDGTLFIQPGNAIKYSNRKSNFPYKIDKKDLAYKLFKQHGFRWGGDWSKFKDYQHFDR